MIGKLRVNGRRWLEISSACILFLFGVPTYSAEQRCYTEKELEAEVGFGFLTGQGAAAFLCDRDFPELQLFGRHQQIMKKFEPKFASFMIVLAGQFGRTWPETWKGRYDQYVEERAKQVAGILAGQITKEYCIAFGEALVERSRSGWASIQRQLDANVATTRSHVQICSASR